MNVQTDYHSGVGSPPARVTKIVSICSPPAGNLRTLPSHIPISRDGASFESDAFGTNWISSGLVQGTLLLATAKAIVFDVPSVMSPTGSGKSTQLPQILYRHNLLGDGEVVILQPRRIAARKLDAAD